MAKKPKKAAKSKAKTSKNKSSKSKLKKAPAKTSRVKSKAKAKRAASNRTETVLPKELEARLMALAVQMDKSMDAVLIQALCEFADAWEEHFRTVNVIIEEDERVQIVVKPEE
jgi:type IV secretory pathway VirB10-like protein